MTVSPTKQAYNDAHRERIRQLHNQWRADHLDEVRAKDRERMKNRSEARKQYEQEYYSRPEIQGRKRRDSRARHLMSKYGITVDEYDALLDIQDGKCAICGTDQPSARGILYIDHDHSTNKVRGLLCHHCNVGIGHFQDSSALLRKASRYLEGVMQ